MAQVKMLQTITDLLHKVQPAVDRFLQWTAKPVVVTNWTMVLFAMFMIATAGALTEVKVNCDRLACSIEDVRVARIRIIDQTERVDWQYHKNRSSLYEQAFYAIFEATADDAMRDTLLLTLIAFQEQDSIYAILKGIGGAVDTNSAEGAQKP